MALFVKICGLCSAADVEAAAAVQPDALGFIFFPGSRRCVNPADVAAWTRGLPAGMLKVGVFVDEPAERVQEIASAAGLDVVQLHGDETPECCGRAWPRVWKALPVRPDDARWFAPYPVEALVADTPGGPLPGGTGRAGDWSLAAVIVGRTPQRVILAGGLSPRNVAAAVQQVRPWGVDVSSGVEAGPGRKDAAKMKDFVDLCRKL